MTDFAKILIKTTSTKIKYLEFLCLFSHCSLPQNTDVYICNMCEFVSLSLFTVNEHFKGYTNYNVHLVLSSDRCVNWGNLKNGEFSNVECATNYLPNAFLLIYIYWRDMTTLI